MVLYGGLRSHRVVGVVWLKGVSAVKKKVKCWECFQCNEKECPVFKSKELNCWLIAGTHCRNEIQGKFLEKVEMCLECEPFKANMDADSMEETLKVLNEQLTEFRHMVDERDRELESTSVELALGLSEVFEALKKISSGDPEVRIPEASQLELIAKLKHMVNRTAENLGEIVGLSHEFAIGLAEHFDVLNRVSHGDLMARVSGTSQVDLLESLKRITNEMIQSVSREISERKLAEGASQESEERFRQTAALSPFPISIIDSDGRYLYLNKKFTEVFGYTLEDIPTGRDWFHQAYPDPAYRREVISAWKGDLDKSGALEVRIREFRVVCKDGKLRDIVFRPISMDNGKQFVTYEDLTDRKQAEEALRASEQKYRTLFELAASSIVLIDGETGAFVEFNKRTHENLGFTHEEFEQLKIADFEVIESPENVLSHLRKVTKEGADRFETKHRTKSGEIRNIHVSSKTITIQGKDYIQSVWRDITELKQTQAKLEDMFTQIKKGHDDHLAILNMLRLGIATVDKNGRVTFLNKTAQDLIGKSLTAVFGGHWEALFQFDAQDKARLNDMLRHPREARKRLQAQVEFQEGRRSWMDIEVQDDPRTPDRKIFFLYDMSEIYDLRRMLEEKAQFHDLVGKSKPMQAVYQRIKEASKVDWTVLIEGSTGTGKELVARAIHFSSHRKKKPFIAVNCAGLADSLLTSQLFGHKRGAFTGAVEDHKGFFEVANGGTLLLDEIGDISKNMQTSLLRVLEEKEITRLGESTPRKIDVRVLASTHRDLSQEAARGHFRPDLLYRIRIARIKLPLLRERREDIPLLVASFLGQSRAATGKPVKDVSREAMRILLQYDWPGNVRELKSAIDFATLHCKGSVINAENLPPEIVYSRYPGPPPSNQHADEKQRVLAALETAGGNRTAAASQLGISRATLYRRLARLDIKSVK
jgi:PAS domain S-box-containing protein